MRTNSAPAPESPNADWSATSAFSEGWKTATGNLGLVVATATKLMIPAMIGGAVVGGLSAGFGAFLANAESQGMELPMAVFVGFGAAMLIATLFQAIVQSYGNAAASAGILAHVEKQLAPDSFGNAMPKRTPGFAAIFAAGALPAFLLAAPQTLMQVMQMTGNGPGVQSQPAIAIATLVLLVSGGLFYGVRMAFWPFVATDQRSLGGLELWKRTLALTGQSWGRIFGVMMLTQLVTLIPIVLVTGIAVALFQGFGQQEPWMRVVIGAFGLAALGFLLVVQTAYITSLAWSYLQQVGTNRVYARLGLDKPAPHVDPKNQN